MYVEEGGQRFHSEWKDSVGSLTCLKSVSPGSCGLTRENWLMGDETGEKNAKKKEKIVYRMQGQIKMLTAWELFKKKQLLSDWVWLRPGVM